MDNRFRIEKIFAHEVLDSRGNPTVEVYAYSSNGKCGRAIVPSGASTGKYEAVELRDNDMDRFTGKGVLNAVKNINEIIAPKLVSLNSCDQSQIDEQMIELDGTEDKSKLGANAILGVSMAICNLSANILEVPLYKYLGGVSGRNIPYPMMNIINGGRHSDNNVNIQEFMIVPQNVDSFSQRLRMCSEVYARLKEILKNNRKSTAVGDEGGFAPNLDEDEDAIKLIMGAIHECGYKDYFGIALDVAASEMFKGGKYHFWKTNQTKTTSEMIEYYEELVNKYPIVSIEDGLADEDIDGWKMLTNKIGNKVMLVGDDLFTTNISRLRDGIDGGYANSILIKPNQIGTVTETIDTVRLAKSNGYTPIISHRSGETEDTFIADFAVGLNLRYIKSGAPARTERIAKYNQLLRIERNIWNKM